MGETLSYEITFQQDFSYLTESLLAAGFQGCKICIVTDSNVGSLYAGQVKSALLEASFSAAVFELPAGEENKHLGTVEKLYAFLISNGFERKDLLLALGGGVVGDLTGFAAATYLRGIAFVQVPTTLLAQVDSSIGGKTGVDFQQYKNMVGAFHQPSLVYMNLNTLSSLPDVEFSCGMGEVLKSALLADREYYFWLLEKRDNIWARDFAALEEMIRRCCRIKQRIVERDPKEQGERALLNLGHTIGHAVEKLKDFMLHHGQCVGLGTVAAAYISRKRGLLSQEDFAQIEEGNRAYSLPCRVDGLKPEEVLDATKKDKKMEQGRVKFILLDRLGHAFIDRSVTDQEMSDAICYILDEGQE